jgi:trk system potassium uptake protein TrkA
VHSLRRGAAEALELIAHGDARSSKVVGRRIEELDLPKGVTVGAIVRTRPRKPNGGAGGKPEELDHQVLIAHHDTLIEAEDHVIVFATSKHLVAKVEKLFQVGLGFF